MRSAALYLLLFGFFYMPCVSLVQAQVPGAPSSLQVLGTRSWIRVAWRDRSGRAVGYRIYWSRSGIKPSLPGASIPAGHARYYITPVEPLSRYTVWVEAYNTGGISPARRTSVFTSKSWTLDSAEAGDLSIPSSSAVPAGMELFWQDEFNDALLNRNKWTTAYYSTIDYKDGANLQALQNDTLPRAGYRMTDSTIDLITDDSLPERFFWPGRKVSSIQTYDWGTGENLLDNSRGGYYEVRVRRGNNPSSLPGVNCAYWFDSPGPDLRYYMGKEDTAFGVTGIRPHGQAFEIDVFEENGTQPHTTPFTLHGRVKANGTFLGNLATFNASGDFQNNWVVHGLLWTPTGIRYYINGVLQHTWNDPGKVMSPDHFMNILLGVYGGWTYGKGNSAHMEVDYIRGYQWPIVRGNELPDPGFEYGIGLYPWEGTGTRSNANRTGKFGVALGPGQWVEQYVYLNNHQEYTASYWLRGAGTLDVELDNVQPVSLKVIDAYKKKSVADGHFTKGTLDFTTAPAYGNHMRTVRIRLTNNGSSPIAIDDLSLAKGGDGGQPDQ